MTVGVVLDPVMGEEDMVQWYTVVV